MTPGPASAAFEAALDRSRRLSRYVERMLGAHPGLVDELREAGNRPLAPAEMRAALEGPGGQMGDRLRALRRRAMVRLAFRDLNGLAALDEVFETMTALADACIAAAAGEAHQRAAAVHGEPRDGARLTVVALGKLGGCELNVSSDVDLVFLFAGEGETAGPRAVTHAEFFAAVGRELIALLSELDAGGQAFRVDMRLRPFGDSGPLVTSLSALEDYFIGHARPWERYAWLKARVVCGPSEGLAERVAPFVYRRYLDYGMLESLREMHGRIAQAAVQRRKVDDIKVGVGGIREVEFAVQLFQMVRGGRDAGLRLTSTRAALEAVAERGLVPREAATELRAAYDFLRRLEHRLQYHDDQQTQALPRAAEHQALIAEAMDFPSWEALVPELARHRARVETTFEALFERREAPAHSLPETLAAWLFDPQGTPDPEGLGEELQRAGIVEPGPVAARLIELTRSRRYRSLSAASRGKVERLLPAAIGAAARHGGGADAATRLLDLLEAIDGREAYFSLLLEFPRVLDRAARLVSRSRWAARLLARHPILLDELTRSVETFTVTDWPAERAALEAECLEIAGDVERLLDHLRHFKQRHVLRLTLADVEGELPVMALSDELSALADVVLDVTLVEAAKSVGMETKRGPRPRGDDEKELGPHRHGDDPSRPGIPGFCVVGYGKLGGKELGYGSDLDVIFLYDEAMAAQAQNLARVAQRVNTWMTTLTPAGVLYETDLRLRPDGASGLMVSSIAAFRDYQAKRAWTWEHQALTRARACAGDAALGARFEQVRDEILALPREEPKLLEEIVAMRRKMRAEHRHESKDDLKHVEGGVIDLEFCVQAMVLAHGPRHPRLRENKGNHTLLKRMGELGLLPVAVAVEAADAYLAMRRRAHAAALNDEDGVKIGPGELVAERAAVVRLWKEVFRP
jgi:glutamate-ammonia-ligase adenylyltransferase